MVRNICRDLDFASVSTYFKFFPKLKYWDKMIYCIKKPEKLKRYNYPFDSLQYSGWFEQFTLREKYPNTELFLVRIFLYLD